MLPLEYIYPPVLISFYFKSKLIPQQRRITLQRYRRAWFHILDS